MKTSMKSSYLINIASLINSANSSTSSVYRSKDQVSEKASLSNSPTYLQRHLIGEQENVDLKKILANFDPMSNS